MTVRAFRVQAAHVAKQADLLQKSLRISLPMYATNRWLGVRIESMGAVLVCIVAITCTVVIPRRYPLFYLALSPPRCTALKKLKIH